ncbi:serine-type D-Ala-D-Ala carboxypeptidase [Ahniella affigens]|uniref:serine-type D-Ala-D-Ala carboxypeptidase n=1 Tax=Ahniella affigens TaxID=2021234 RepID=A0A2P1PPE6_9GAMM|nr:D-alanyl-D-alanine carboxypeptidase family protein [Ahniella affigens]AVP96719.1 serine-type D-Ala-D-Ala carboxypeptidase [Ahniella affigens]
MTKFLAVSLSLVLSPLLAAQTPNALPLPTPAQTSNAPVPPPPELTASNYVLMDYLTGRVLAEKKGDEQVVPASITKIMTSYVVAAEKKAGKIRPEDRVMISENAWSGGGAGTDGSTSFLPVNQTVALSDLELGMIVQSGNDASIALAEHVAGNEATFAALMNQYGQKIGLKNSHFTNATGLFDPNHYSTAHDIGLLSQALIRDFPDEYALYKTKNFSFNGITQGNRNLLLFRDPSVDGIKTGHLSQAGFCLAASAQRGDTRLISVVMNTASEKVRAAESQALLEYGFRFFETHKVYAASQLITETNLWRGEAPKAKLGLANDAMLTIPRGAYSRLEASMNIVQPLSAPLSKGQEVGKLNVKLDGALLLEQPLVALEDYPEGGFFKRLSDSVWLWFDDGQE